MTREELNQSKQDTIINEVRREKQKKIVTFVIKLILFLGILITLFYLFNTYISTAKIIVKENRIIDEKFPDSFNGTKIIQFSDLHFGSNIRIGEVEELIKLINSRNPDIVVFTGDLIDKNYTISSKEQELLTKQLNNINAKLGKYAVMGNEDKDNFITIFNQSKFIVLDNDYDLLYRDSNFPILIVGNSSLLKDNSDINKAYSYFDIATSNKDIYTISLGHEPDMIDDIVSRYKTDLFLSGHSHNGNVNLPFLDNIYKIQGAEKYYKESYTIGKSKLYISSGIGTSGAGIRFLCQPSINFFRLSNK